VSIAAEGLQSETENQNAFVSEIFHLLSQPLTALHCALDLSLRGDQTVDKLHASLQSAMESAERLRQSLLLVRTLKDASDPGDLSGCIDLKEMLRTLHEDMLPLFQSAGKKFTLKETADAFPVCVNPARMMRALLCFVEYLSRYLPDGAALDIRLARGGDRTAVIEISSASRLPMAPPGDACPAPYSCEIEIARRSFRAAGGDFSFVSGNCDAGLWRATLPLV
jgi:signal transduction histidine kinase